MAEYFSGASADDVWRDAMSRLNDPAVQVVDSRGGETREILHAVFSISDPRQRWVLSRDPAMNPAFAIVEVIWIMRGRNDSAFVTAWNKALPRFAGKGAKFHGAYGFRLKQSFGVDQVKAAYHILKSNPTSRQVVLQVWDPRIDLPEADGQPRDPDIPCNICSLLKIRGNRLEWCQLIRSNDLVLGFPYNVVQWTCLQEIIAGWLGVEIGEYMQISDSAHIYSRDYAIFTNPTRSNSEAKIVDDLRLSYEVSCAVIAELETRILRLAQVDLSEKSLTNALSSLGHNGYDNLLYVLGAEAARRRGWASLATTIIEQCTNRVLAALWNRWRERLRDKER